MSLRLRFLPLGLLFAIGVGIPSVAFAARVKVKVNHKSSALKYILDPPENTQTLQVIIPNLCSESPLIWLYSQRMSSRSLVRVYCGAKPKKYYSEEERDHMILERLEWIIDISVSTGEVRIHEEVFGSFGWKKQTIRSPEFERIDQFVQQGARITRFTKKRKIFGTECSRINEVQCALDTINHRYYALKIEERRLWIELVDYSNLGGRYKQAFEQRQSLAGRIPPSAVNGFVQESVLAFLGERPSTEDTLDLKAYLKSFEFESEAIESRLREHELGAEKERSERVKRAFLRAEEIGTLESYQAFLDNHKGKVDGVPMTNIYFTKAITRVVEERDFKTHYPLVYATLRGDVVRVRTLLRKGHNPHEVARTHTGDTSWESACSSGDEKLVEVFLLEGTNVDRSSFFGETCLHKRAMNGDEEMVALLLRYGADPNLTTLPYGYSALDHARRNGHTEIVGLLLRKGAGVGNPYSVEETILGAQILGTLKLGEMAVDGIKKLGTATDAISVHFQFNEFEGEYAGWEWAEVRRENGSLVERKRRLALGILGLERGIYNLYLYENETDEWFEWTPSRARIDLRSCSEDSDINVRVSPFGFDASQCS